MASAGAELGCGPGTIASCDWKTMQSKGNHKLKFSLHVLCISERLCTCSVLLSFHSVSLLIRAIVLPPHWHEWRKDSSNLCLALNLFGSFFSFF